MYIGLGFLTPIISIAGYFIYHGKLANYIYMLWEFPLQSTDSYRMNFNEFKIAFLNKLNLDETISFELILFIVLITILIYLFKNINQLIESDISFLNILLLIFWLFQLFLVVDCLIIILFNCSRLLQFYLE